jgi:Regulator of chromosome condensation (RCC1) repeat/IPT/TIG domain
MDLWMARRGAGRVVRLMSGSALALLIALVIAAPAGAYGAAAWGENLYRQLGDGSSNAASALPVAVSGLSGVTAISAGGHHSLALLSNATVVAWGNDEAGQLGDGGSTLSNVPVAVKALTGVKAIAAGANHSLALLTNGTVMAWGENEEGQLGNGKTTDSAVPVAVKALTGVKAIAAGGNHSLALLTNGTVMAWGENQEGQLGNGKLTNASSPVAVRSLSGVSAIAAGAHHSLALLTSGALMAWGSNLYGQLGHPESGEAEEEALATVPVSVLGVSGASAIAAGGQRTMALLANATVMDWGDNSWGALGTGGGGAFSDIPLAVSGLGQVSGISAGTLHSLTFGEPTPAVSGLSPNSGPSAGASTVTITGSNLAAASAVYFGSHPATSFTVNSAASITAIAPAGTGTVDVTVTTPAGVSPAHAVDRFTYLAPPILKKLAPNTGPAGGASAVTITGSGFTNVSAVHFGASNATSFVVNSTTSITAVSPPATPGTAEVSVTTTSGTSALVAGDRFKYAPSVDSISPNGGPIAGHVEVTISGSGFALGATATIIKFATKRAGSVNCSSSTTCTTLIPAHEAGTVDVRVTVNKVTSPIALGDSFTYG